MIYGRCIEATTNPITTKKNMAYSYDGINWVVKDPNIPGASSLNGIAFNSKRQHTITFPKNRLVAVGRYTGRSIIYSDDGGVTWNNVGCCWRFYFFCIF